MALLLDDEADLEADQPGSPASDDVPVPSPLLASAEAESQHPLVQSQTNYSEDKMHDFLQGEEIHSTISMND